VAADPLAFLQSWYANQCDGDWEHDWGAAITTIDNPGWRVRLNLSGTNLEGRIFERVVHEIDEANWSHCWSDGQVFEAACGALNLLEVLRMFQRFATHSAGPDS
jgi:hypothetical protein